MQTYVNRSRRFTTYLYVSLIILAIFGGVFARAQETTEAEVTPPAESTYETEGIPGGSGIVGDFVVGPGKIDATLNPGETKVVEMLVTNRTGERRAFNLTVEDMTGSNDPSTPIVLLGDVRGPYSLKDYLKVPHMRFELEHNERARIPVTISIPTDAEPGGLYGSLLVDTVAIEADSGESSQTVPQSAIVARIGTLFFITVAGETHHEGKLIEFGTIGKKQFYGNGPISFGILHENTGSIHMAPYGELRIKNMLGEEVGAVQLEPWFILPSSIRLREISWDREFLLGRYTATVEINRGYEDIVDIASFTFWVLPWKVLAVGFGAVFIIILVFRLFFRTFEFRRKS